MIKSALYFSEANALGEAALLLNNELNTNKLDLDIAIKSGDTGSIDFAESVLTATRFALMKIQIMGLRCWTP
ncbi:hypothetical protein [Enterovibrio calviensis]|uniref:hypothetical protein n=1 Tax=Enterovibrio calviensis TaxID=91359 RepID=UPI00048484F7|nr:hypothetical protein [Enterovibrio calviensis]